MTILVKDYATKKDLKAAKGQPLKYVETSFFEYTPDGKLTVARRPHLAGGGREWFAIVTMKNGLIHKVS